KGDGSNASRGIPNMLGLEVPPDDRALLLRGPQIAPHVVRQLCLLPHPARPLRVGLHVVVEVTVQTQAGVNLVARCHRAGAAIAPPVPPQSEQADAGHQLPAAGASVLALLPTGALPQRRPLFF